MEYKAKFTLKITDIRCSIFTVGYKDFTLPFVPHVGMKLLETGEPNHPSAIQKYPITEVCWCDNEKSFHCRIDINEVDNDAEVGVDFLVKIAKECGWKGFSQKHTEQETQKPRNYIKL